MKMIKESNYIYVCVEDEDNTTLLPCEKQQPEATTTSTTARGGATYGQRYKTGEREREREGGEERE